MKPFPTISILGLFLLTAFFSFAQNKITFLVKRLSTLHKSEPLFIAGNFNSWDPGDKDFQIDTAAHAITVMLSRGAYEYKFTRGSWEKRECSSEGKDIPNRVLNVSVDTTINVEVEEWSDDFTQPASPEITHTASSNVKIMDTAFFMPQLNRKRRIWIYLPPDYRVTKNRYPVIYMHDGQNLFDNATSYSGEWGIDEYLDSIFTSGKKEAIVVGVENGLAKRMNEYNPWSFRQYGAGEGNEYVDFLVKDLKSFIDQHYRTLAGKENTLIVGSSMGGLISLFGVLKYPSVFGGAGIFSPALWTAPAMDSLAVSRAGTVNSKLFFYAGGEEGDSMVLNMQRVEKEIKKTSPSPIHEIIDPAAQHNEAAWRKYFPAFYEWAIVRQKK
jgi:predicted alpha/beta superfamily hydrolase